MADNRITSEVMLFFHMLRAKCDTKGQIEEDFIARMNERHDRAKQIAKEFRAKEQKK